MMVCFDIVNVVLVTSIAEIDKGDGSRTHANWWQIVIHLPCWCSKPTSSWKNCTRREEASLVRSHEWTRDEVSLRFVCQLIGHSTATEWKNMWNYSELCDGQIDSCPNIRLTQMWVIYELPLWNRATTFDLNTENRNCSRLYSRIDRWMNFEKTPSNQRRRIEWKPHDSRRKW